jgi:hypothetical protein
MEFNFSLPRLLLFAAFLAAFWFLGGFSAPVVSIDGLHDARRVSEAWIKMVALFVVGAGSASLVDHYIGNLDRSNLRLLYILIGLGMMTISCLWLRGLKQSLV